MFDFTKNTWSNQPEEIEIPKIPINTGQQQISFDKIDLQILSELELDPTTKMNKIAELNGISPQLISYHKEKHIEGLGLITGYIPGRRTKYTDMKILMKHRAGQEDLLHDYLHLLVASTKGCHERLHVPNTHNEDILTDEILSIGVRQFTIPSEHYRDEGIWTRMDVFLEQLNLLLRAIE